MSISEKEKRNIRNRDNDAKNQITNDVLLPKLQNEPDNKIMFNYEKDTEVIREIAILKSTCDVRFADTFESVYEILEKLLENDNYQVIDNIGYVFYLDETEYKSLEHTIVNTNTNFFKYNIVKYQINDSYNYNIDGEHIKGDQLSIDNIKYSTIPDIINNTNKSKLPKINDLIKDKSIEVSKITP